MFPSVSGYGLVSAYEDSGYGLVSAYFSVRFFSTPFSLSAWSSAWYQAETSSFGLIGEFTSLNGLVGGKV